MTTVAMIGFGEVGRCYVEALAAHGVAIVGITEPRLSPAGEDLARQLALTVHGAIGTWIAEADIVLSAVSGDAALPAATAALARMKAGSCLVDLSTATPEAMQTIAALAASASVSFIDVAIMGGITLGGAKTPLLCAGTGMEPFIALMRSLGTPVRVVHDGRAGDAVRLKLLRSVFAKGMEGLAVECLVLAESMGLRKQLYDNLADINQADLPTFLDMLVRTHVIHAGRRLHEVENASKQLQEAGFESVVTEGVAALFKRSVNGLADFKPSPDVTVAQALDALTRTARITTAANALQHAAPSMTAAPAKA
jgi:3-hydroxyisobutyrate dehydrogenase-like beta-hydroxyacid dehydrogenase